MTLHQLIVLGATLSIVSFVFALGLKAADGDLMHLVRRPGKLVSALVAMNVVMPIFAVITCLILPLPLAVEIAIVALSLSPVPPIVPGKLIKAGGSQSYSLSLLFIAALAAIAIVPVALELVERAFGADYQMPASRVVMPVLLTVAAPLLLAVGFRKLFPSLAARLHPGIGKLSTLILVLTVLPLLVASGPAFWAQVGNGIVLALAGFSIVGLAVGHVMGGPEEVDRTDLAIMTATRHPGIAIGIASLNFPQITEASAVILWHLIISAVVAFPYLRWRRRVHHAGASDQMMPESPQDEDR